MNAKQIHRFAQSYFEATECTLLEKSPSHFVVKLSPRADKELTNRPYYWSFVERTGADPDTMTFLFITDRDGYAAREAASAPRQDPEAAAADAVLARTFGHIQPNALNTARMPREELYFGSRRLDQLFESAKAGGRFVCLFQEPETRSAHPFDSVPYTPWLGLNVKVEFLCDRKREEIHSYGISLATGRVEENFHDRLLGLRMTPKLPPNVHVTRHGITLARAAAIAETALERRLRAGDYRWAEEAAGRLADELAQVRHYYEPLLASAEEENRDAIEARFRSRESEIRWQYQPRVTVTTINGGIFHLSGLN